ncbi:sulfoxide reductase heme-binding subunit YedZ [Streptacidiphilus sp. MAP12-16]|uniref:ferric reductase-like transmembrane domain-containing protein n=1 Tax=Streptacidiphilus sp. MAP12-16 TaxID=3156300 RepID=UPI003517BA72
MTATTPVLWYASQATGVVCLVLFSAVTLLGVMVRLRTSLPGLPRFGTVTLHRSLSLMAMLFLAVHILTAVGDSFVNISLLDAVLPFVSGYQPLWLGLGTVAFDLMLAVVVTSLLRARLGHRSWRAVHWLAYASWPVAVVHGITLGSGSGHPVSGAALWLTVGCVAPVLVAIAVRLYLAARPSAPTTPAGLLAASGFPATGVPATGAGARDLATTSTRNGA